MPSPSISLPAEVLAALATMPSTSPSVLEVVENLGRPEARVRAVLTRLERTGLVESWPDPARFGSIRVMLSGRSAARLGLELDPSGERWVPARRPIDG